MKKFNVSYSTWEGKSRKTLTVEAPSGGEAVKVVEDNIRAQGLTPKSIGPAEELRSK